MQLLRPARALRAKGLLVYPHELRAEKEQIYGTRYKKDELPQLRGAASTIPMRLLQDMHGVGRAGEVVEINTSTARAFTFPQRIGTYLNYAERQEYELMKMDLANWVSDQETAYSLADAAHGRFGVPSIGATLRRARENVLREEAIATGFDADTAADLAVAARAAAATATTRELEDTAANAARTNSGSVADATRAAAQDPLASRAGVAPVDPARAADIAAKKAAGLKQRLATIAQKRQVTSNARVGRPPFTL